MLQTTSGGVRFGETLIDEAAGAILGHSWRAGGINFSKGRRLSDKDIARLKAAGVSSVVAARLDPDDVHEDEAAESVAKALAGPGIEVTAPFTGLVAVRVRLEIEGDQIRYDLSGSHPAVGTFLNAGFGSAISGVAGGTKTFFPDVPLNSGFYRAVEIDLGPEGSVVNAVNAAGGRDSKDSRPVNKDRLPARVISRASRRRGKRLLRPPAVARRAPAVSGRRPASCASA